LVAGSDSLPVSLRSFPFEGESAVGLKLEFCLFT
jgi:hypothetical protein